MVLFAPKLKKMAKHEKSQKLMMNFDRVSEVEKERDEKSALLVKRKG